jgi:3-methyladenine DNA glycosylase/8-oxoguanine DNA glycosylase
VTLTLPYRPPYDWKGIIDFLALRAVPGIEVVQPDCYARTITLGARHGTIVVRPAEGNALLASIRFPDVTALPAIVERIRRIFDLGADPCVIEGHLSADTVLAPLIAARPGLRVPGAWDAFEVAVRGILGQQITLGGATRLVGKLVERFGDPAESGVEGLSRIFPAPAQIAQADLAGVLGVPGARAAALRSLGASAAADPAILAPGRDLDEAVARLKTLPGIGEWTAQYIAMRALREPDAFLAADIGLLRAMATPSGRPTPAALLARAASWRPWRSYAVLHLWTSENPVETRLETAA